MTLGLTDYVSPKLELRRKSIDGQNGVYTTRIIQKGELIVVWGGNIVTSQELAALSLRIQRSALQVEGDLYIVSSTDWRFVTTLTIPVIQMLVYVDKLRWSRFVQSCREKRSAMIMP